MQMIVDMRLINACRRQVKSASNDLRGYCNANVYQLEYSYAVRARMLALSSRS